VGWRVPDFTTFSGEGSRTTWEHVSQYLAQLGEAGSVEALCIQLFSLSLIGTAFAWFSSLPAHSIYGWEPLEQKFHEHFYSGTIEAKLLDLTSVKQTHDESVSDYFKQFKEIKNGVLIYLSLKRVLLIWPSMGCVLILEKNWRVIFIYRLRNCNNLLWFKKIESRTLKKSLGHHITKCTWLNIVRIVWTMSLVRC
jgi:hypothetical protein